MTKLFGTDGIRGEAGVFPLDEATVELIGASLAHNLNLRLSRPATVIIGRDTRESGERIEQALIRGINKTGAQSKSAGVITTPGVAYLTRTEPADAGVVISASHNPFQDNGIKIFSPSGQKLAEDTETLIERDVFDRREFSSDRPSPSKMKIATKAQTLAAAYLDFLIDDIGKGLSLRDLRLIVDCANGAASNFAPALFSRLGAQVTAINNRPDGRNINLDCGSLHIESLQRAVIEDRADIGIAFDGDADRSLFVDANGNFVNGDATLWVLGNYLQGKSQLHDNLVVATVMSNIGLEVAFKSRGIELVRTDVGDKYVLEELLRSGASLGGEQSGHIIFPGISLAGDGMITTLSLLRVMTEERRALHKLTDGFRSFPQILVNVRVKEKTPFNQIEVIQRTAKSIENRLASNGRLLLRYSGTEPLARIMIEGESQSEIENYANEIAAVIEETLGNKSALT
jgi:phosphoglucosamine mutase